MYAVGVPVASTGREISVDCSHALVADWAHTFMATFAGEDQTLAVEVHILDLQIGQLRQAAAGVDETPDEGRVPPAKAHVLRLTED